MKNKILITGAAGFIGYHLTKRILENSMSVSVVGIDNLNDYYEISLKESRLTQLSTYSNFHFHKLDIADKDDLMELFLSHKFDIVIHLAAQAGVRYSITNPDAYISSNVVGHFNILEACRTYMPSHLLYASSSSVYGNNTKTPYSTDDKTDSPVSLYAASKKSCELLSVTYSHLYNVSITGLRFFTVYGPYGRPDMAYFSFTNRIVKGEPIILFNNGDMLRDFTYVDDIVNGIIGLIDFPPEQHVLYNIGNHSPVRLLEFVHILEKVLLEEHVVKDRIKINLLDGMQPGDVYQTYADVAPLFHKVGFKPETTLEEGLRRFAKWYKSYYKV